jgi:hypothetical protein
LKTSLLPAQSNCVFAKRSGYSSASSLAKPFTCATPSLKGNFAGLLRQGELSSQLSCTILVDPVSMREKAGFEVRDLDAAGLTVGKVVEQLARAAGLRMVLEGGVVWLRP